VEKITTQTAPETLKTQPISVPIRSSTPIVNKTIPIVQNRPVIPPPGPI
jgi:hypothetical protein